MFLVVSNSSPKKRWLTASPIKLHIIPTGCIDSDSSSYSKRITSTCETKFPSTRKCTYYPSQKKMRRPKCPYFPVYIPRKTHVEGKRFFFYHCCIHALNTVIFVKHIILAYRVGMLFPKSAVTSWEAWEDWIFFTGRLHLLRNNASFR